MYIILTICNTMIVWSKKTLSIIPLTHIPWVKCLLKVSVNVEGFNEMQTKNIVPVCEKCQQLVLFLDTIRSTYPFVRLFCC